MKKNSFLAYIYVFIFVLYRASLAYSQETCPPSSQNLETVKKLVINNLDMASKLGACSRSVCDAAQAMNGIIFHRIPSGGYAEGLVLTLKNFGLERYFEDLRLKNPQFFKDRTLFKEKVRELDAEHPVAKAQLYSNRPSLFDYSSPINFYQEALKMTDGNVFRAVTLLGSIGHDDVFIPEESNLFALQSLGEEVVVDAKVKERTIRASKKAIEKEAGTDAGGTFNYHMSAGMYLGCELSKKGFKSGDITAAVMDGILKLQIGGMSFSDAVLKNFLEKRRKKGLLFDSYCLDLCIDLPTLSSYVYKKMGVLEYIESEDAKYLFEKGYTEPFMYEEGKYKIPKGWTKERIEKAVAELDYRLMHIEYGMAQHEAGAKFGEKVCREYAEKISAKAQKDPRDLDYGETRIPMPEESIIIANLAVLIKDENASVRRSAIYVFILGEMGEKAIPLLIEALKDNDAYVRLNAAVALKNTGGKAQSAILQLTEALKDPDPDVREAAQEALEKISEQKK